MKLIYLKSALRRNSFDVTIGIKVLFLRVSVTIEPGRSLLQFVTPNCLITGKMRGLPSTKTIWRTPYLKEWNFFYYKFTVFSPHPRNFSDYPSPSHFSRWLGICLLIIQSKDKAETKGDSPFFRWFGLRPSKTDKAKTKDRKNT